VIEFGDAIRLVISEHRKANTRELVGERTRGFVVATALLQVQCPASQLIERSAHAVGYGGGPQYGPCAMREQHSQVTIAALGQTTEIARSPRRADI